MVGSEWFHCGYSDRWINNSVYIRQTAREFFVPCSVGYLILKALKFCPSSFQPTSYIKQFQISKCKRGRPRIFFHAKPAPDSESLRFWPLPTAVHPSVITVFLLPDHSIVESYPLLKSGSGRSFNGCKIRSAIFTRT